MKYKLFLDYATVFVAVFIADVIWALYIQEVSNRNAILAASYSMFVYLAGAYAVTKYVENKRMLIPAVLGAFLGTYIAIVL